MTDCIMMTIMIVITFFKALIHSSS